MSVKLHSYLKFATTHHASDLHFSSGEPVRCRIHGDLVAIEKNTNDANMIYGLFSPIFSKQDLERFDVHKNLDKSYFIEGLGNFRINLFLTRKGISAVIRVIPSAVPSMDELCLPEIAKKFSNLSKGLVLVTGPTGSGKSTSIAAMIDHINTHSPCHILTIEDPIEFIHQNKKALMSQREIGATCNSFAEGLKFALREDPDVILVGEMRDLETISLALTAAETGHLVFATLHTRGAAASIDRMIDSFPANQQAMIRTMLSESLVGVISQTLLKKKEGKGRVAAYEVMVNTPAISNLIREGKSFQIPSIIQTARKDGMILMSQSIEELLRRDLVDPEEASLYLEECNGIKFKINSQNSWNPNVVKNNTLVKDQGLNSTENQSSSSWNLSSSSSIHSAQNKSIQGKSTLQTEQKGKQEGIRPPPLLQNKK